MSSRIALVTAPRIAHRWPDSETPGVVDALVARGADVDLVAWYADTDWSAYDMAVLRSPWDAYWHLTDYLAWLDATGRATALHNPADVVRWNLDKHYLGELHAAGVATIPTTFVEPGDSAAFPGTAFVVKPVVSAGALDTARYASGDDAAALAHVAALHARGLAAMIQPYVDSVDSRGEAALVFYNGVFDHAIRKAAVLKPGETPDTVRNSHPSPTQYVPSAAEIDLAERALRVAPASAPVLYARVDMAQLDDGTPALMELELADPVLFLAHSDGATERYADAIMSLL